jgi:hypothetical protein
MDDATRRVNPAPLRALLRCRVAREDEALHEVRIARVGLDGALDEHRAALDAADRHEAARRRQEAALIAGLFGRPQAPSRLMTARHAIEHLAETAVRLAGEAEEAAETVRQSEEMLAEARAAHARRARETQKWRKTLERVETARRDDAAAQEEGELEDELADRAARRAPRGVGA